MNDEDKKYIENEISKAKLEVYEKRINFLIAVIGGVVALFGIIFPILMSNISTDKIDSAISRLDSRLEKFDLSTDNKFEKMEKKLNDELADVKNEFKSLSVEQQRTLFNVQKNFDEKIVEYNNKIDAVTKEAYRKPELVCFVNGQPISEEIKTDKKHLNLELKLFNKGDGIAQDIKAYAYVEDIKEIRPNMITYDEGTEGIDGYYPVKIYYENFNLDPKQSRIFSLSLEMDRKIETASVNIILRFLYGQPEPTEYKFKLVVE